MLGFTGRGWSLEKEEEEGHAHERVEKRERFVEALVTRAANKAMDKNVEATILVINLSRLCNPSTPPLIGSDFSYNLQVKYPIPRWSAFNIGGGLPDIDHFISEFFLGQQIL